ncbi:hypothetical protein BDP55DRAFT_626069 [Colletotrichum godetiae]|uniref:DUF7580 domain-containing protein n=1 Tax=Colletotrichum godetiae TaxID=1209918 RepID=A0AAJ0EYT5_9PEZI|nr:uncharacterized protein BDP55DRAFT_626069 [Colletotrichum godetiae]KAK1700497.1 hypothetical protein BDP55DRAFT_626069 [Colletotrichum godetiae]
MPQRCPLMLELLQGCCGRQSSEDIRTSLHNETPLLQIQLKPATSENDIEKFCMPPSSRRVHTDHETHGLGQCLRMAEIAGLVLGAIPLVISAYEHRKALLDSAEAFFHGKKDYDKIIRRLHIEYASYDQNMRILLIHAVNEEELDHMIKNSQHSLWKSEGLAIILRRELGSAYGPTMGLLEDLSDILVSIVAKLDISGSDKVKQQGLAIIVSSNPPQSNSQDLQERFRFEKRLEFTLKKRSVDKKLQAINDFNTHLRNLLQEADKINQLQQDEGSCNKARIQWNDSELHCRKSRRRCGSTWESVFWVKAFQKLGICATTLKILNFPDLCSPKIPKIRFAVPRPVFPPDPPALEIDDTCSSIAGAMYPQTGLDLDSSEILQRLYRVEAQQRHLAQDLMTLDTFLTINTIQLGMGDLLCLAVTRVSSVIQLGKTPWLLQPWSRHNSVFIRLNRNPSIDAKHPYLAYKYETAQVGPPPQVSDSSMILSSRQRMLSLGIMLLEIHCERSLESLMEQADLGRDGFPNKETSYTTASRVLEERINDGQVSFGFKRSIEYCLHFSRQPDAFFENSTFVRSIEKHVLESLEREMQHFLFG